MTVKKRDLTSRRGDAVPRQLPKRKQDREFVVELLKFIKSAEDKLRLTLTVPQDPHHVRLDREGEMSKLFNPELWEKV